MPYLITAGLVAVLTTVFSLQNSMVVQVRFFLWGFQGNLALILVLTFLLGVFGGALFGMTLFRGRRPGSAPPKAEPPQDPIR